MSVQLKLATLAEYIGEDDLDRIENEDDIVFHTQDDSYYVLTEKERNSLAWDILYHEHDSEWYGVDEVSELLGMDKEEIKTIFLSDVLLDNDGVTKSHGELKIEGQKLNSLIDKVMNFPKFIDLYFATYKKENHIGIIITKGNSEEILKNEFYIYRINDL